MEANRKTNWKLLFSLSHGYRRHLFVGVVTTFLAAGMGFAVPFVTSFTLDFVILGKDVKLPLALDALLDMLGGRAYLSSHLYVLGLLLFLLTALGGAFTFWRRRETAYAAEGMARELRNKLYRHLADVPFDYYKHVSTGDLVQRCSSDLDTARRFVSVQLMEIVRTISMVVVAVFVMYKKHVPMALFSTCLLPPLLIGSFVYFKKVQRFFLRSDEAEGKLSTMLQENLTGIRVVRAFGQQAHQVETFTALNADYRDKTYRLTRLLGFYWGFSDSAGYIQILISLIAGVWFSVRGDLTLGDVTLFATYTGMLTWPVRQMGRILADLGKAAVSMGRLDEILSAPVETEPGRAETPDLTGDIVFSHVCFGYDRYNDVLDDVSFTVHPGQTVAILGSTGSGKSSLVQLLQRLYTVSSGHIYINGTDINDIAHGHLRKHIGIVLQEPFLYSRTIRDNIRICRPDASDEEVYSAARASSVHDVITSFEAGYDTIVGERGVTLSGGQQQRVAIARTLMQRAHILIFDDSMSAVDTETDASIRKSLFALGKDGITFLISHRITTLCEADSILVLDGGKLVQQGTHAELMEQDGMYRRIAEIQGMDISPSDGMKGGARA